MDRKRIMKWARNLLIFVVAAYFTIIALNLVFGWSIYGYFFKKLVGYGVPGYLSGILAVWLVAIILWFGPAVILSLLKHRKDWIWKVAIIISIWLGIMYVVSYPYSDSLFNPFTGQSQFRYSRTGNGKIEKFPSAFTVNPKTGLPLHDFDSKVAEEYSEQQEQVKQKSVITKNQSQSYSDTIINMVDSEEINLDWYFNVTHNAFWLKSDRVSLGITKKNFWMRNHWTHHYDLWAEKIIFVPNKYVIIGLCFIGVRNTSAYISDDSRILDFYHTAHQPIKVGILSSKFKKGNEIDLKRGEIKRVLFILNYIDPKKVTKGSYSGSGDKYINFSIKKDTEN